MKITAKEKDTYRPALQRTATFLSGISQAKGKVF